MSALLGYEPVPDEESSERIWLEAPGTHCVATNCKKSCSPRSTTCIRAKARACSCSAPRSGCWRSTSAARCSAGWASCRRTAG